MTLQEQPTSLAEAMLRIEELEEENAELHMLTAKKDPRGLIKNDLAQLRSIFTRKPYRPKDDHASIMYIEGQQSVIAYIETQMVARRD